MESDLKLINECGFDSFEDVIKRINELVNIMRAGRSKAEINLQRFNNQAKEFLKLGQKDKAKKELAKNKRNNEKNENKENEEEEYEEEYEEEDEEEEDSDNSNDNINKYNEEEKQKKERRKN